MSIYESQIINSNEDIRDYIPFLKGRKGRILVSVALHSNIACLYFYAKDLSGMASGVGFQYLTEAAVPMVISEEGSQEEPSLVLDLLSSSDVWDTFSSYTQSVVEAEKSYLLGLVDKFKYHTGQVQEIQDYLAEEYNVKVDARQPNVEFELFDA